MITTKRKTRYTKRRKECAELYLQGWHQTQLAEHFGVNQTTISRDLKAIREDWLQSTVIDFNEAKARELVKLDNLEVKYWEAWERSRLPSDVITKKSNHKAEQAAKVLGVTAIRATRDGDPRFLAGVYKCIEKRIAILGIDAPLKVDVTVSMPPDVEARMMRIEDYIIKMVNADSVTDEFVEHVLSFEDVLQGAEVE